MRVRARADAEHAATEQGARHAARACRRRSLQESDFAPWRRKDKAVGGVMDAAHSGGLLARLHLSSDLAFDHDDSDEDDGGPTQWSTGASRIGSHETLAQMVDRLERQNDELKADLDDEHRALRLMTAELEREERAIRQMCLELEELENHHCPVCQAMVPNTEIDRHMESCLHSLALHVADKVRKTHAAELAWRDTVDRSLQPLHEYDLWVCDRPQPVLSFTHQDHMDWFDEILILFCWPVFISGSMAPRQL